MSSGQRDRQAPRAPLASRSLSVPSFHPGVFAVGALVLGGVLVGAAVGCTGPKIRHNEERSQTIEAGDASALEVHVANGSVTVSVGTPGQVVLKADVRAEAKTGQRARELCGATRVDARREGGKVLIQVEEKAGFGEIVAVDLDIKVPARMKVAAKTSNGTIKVGGVGGAVELESSNGTVYATEVTGSASLKSGNGDIRLAGTPGQVLAKNGNGSIDLKLGGPLSAESQISTGNGTVEIELGPTAGAELQAVVGLGSIEIDPRLGAFQGAKEGKAQGRLGKGGAPLLINTGNGSIKIRPQP